MSEHSFRSIGVARTPFVEKKDAPRQPRAARGVRGVIVLEDTAEMRDAIADLETWSHLWIVYVFDRRGEGWSPKVQPPRESERRGVLSTRSPHRPNPIGLSAVRLERVIGCALHVVDVDMLDGSPVLDVKPYVAYTDAIADASHGWLAEDPRAAWTVIFDDEAERALAWLAARGVALEEPIAKALALGPEPHAYRRIKPDGATSVLALKEWRARFEVRARTIRVLAIESGWRPDQIAKDPTLALHAAFLAR